MKKKIEIKVKPIITDLDWILKNDSPTMLKDMRDYLENKKNGKRKN